MALSFPEWTSVYGEENQRNKSEDNTTFQLDRHFFPTYKLVQLKNVSGPVWTVLIISLITPLPLPPLQTSLVNSDRSGIILSYFITVF